MPIFFSTEVETVHSLETKTSLIVKYPEEIYHINRREHFRFAPQPDDPLAVEFSHGGRKYQFHINEISGGGCSVLLNDRESQLFRISDDTKFIKIFFKGQKVVIPQGSIMYMAEKQKTTAGSEWICGIQFDNLTMGLQDSLVHQIFVAHREYLQDLSNKYVTQ